MAVKVGINGFGRIGRLAFRAMMKDPDIEVVAVNDIGDIPTIAHLLKYDSIHGRAFQSVEVTSDGIVADGCAVKVLSESKPVNLPWKELGVDVVVEATGRFTDAGAARAHIDAGARKVLVTDPSADADACIVVGVNEDSYDQHLHTIVSGASCTANCLAPIAKVLLDNFGIRRATLNAVHSYTNDQKILDLPHKDLRRSRTAAVSMIPTTTGAIQVMGDIIPELKGKIDGFATRVPTPDGSMIDFTAELDRPASIEEINAAMKEASEGAFRGIIEYTEDPIVSIDVVGNPASAVFDSKLTMAMGGKSDLVKCVAWYDNEWGYASRMRDLVKILL